MIKFNKNDNSIIKDISSLKKISIAIMIAGALLLLIMAYETASGTHSVGMGFLFPTTIIMIACGRLAFLCLNLIEKYKILFELNLINNDKAAHQPKPTDQHSAGR